MGDHNSGGGGSVYWTIELDHIPKVTTKPTKDNHWFESGDDPDPKRIENEWFTVSIEVPAEFSNDREAYLKALRDPRSRWGIKAHPGLPDRVYVNVPLKTQKREEPSQIRTSWGNSTNKAAWIGGD